jgi:DNA-directed RNA polymerase specialized sigma subunit
MRESDRIMRQHVEFVRVIAVRLGNQLGLGAPLEELGALGMRDLAEARQRFEPQRGVAFEVFAHYRLRRALMERWRGVARWSQRARARFKAIEALDRAAHAEASRPAAISGTEARLRALDSILTGVAEAYATGLIAPLQTLDSIEA